MALGFTNRVPLRQVELCKPMEQVFGEVGQVTRVVKLFHSQEFGPVSFSIIYQWVVQRMLAPVEQHVHDNPSCEHIHTPRVGLLRDELLRRHEH